ncbi:MAG: hypothetical protein CMJ69_04800 [Planctomycetaceae bacterium]|nr:hypothetical protein [Planctomycetaceae bacterium]
MTISTPRMIIRTQVLLALAFLLASPAILSAQGLIWSLPEQEGTWVRYEGEYKQVEFRPGVATGDQTFNWRRNVTIKSLVTPDAHKTAMYRGKQVTCRWIEIKVETGKPGEQGLDTGPGGARLYKVLIPEARIFGTLINNNSVDADGIPVSFLPIIRGYRKLGNRKEEPIKTKVLQIYPAISLLKHYKAFRPETGQPEDPELAALGAVNAIKWLGGEALQSRVSRSEHSSTIWLSREVPFGLARWNVKITRSRKRETDPREKFEKRTETTVEMKAVAVGTDAKSELAVQ